MSKTKKVGFIGVGNMGFALSSCLAAKPGFEVYVFDQKPAQLAKFKKSSKIKVLDSAAALIAAVDVLVLAIKPQDMSALLKENRSFILSKELLIISIAAGLSLRFFERYLKGAKVVRVMPNLPAKVKEAVSFMAKSKNVKNHDSQTARDVFASAGDVFEVKESFIDKATAISGSGPGYVFYFMDAIYRSAVSLGFNKKDARAMVLKTFSGSVKLALKSGDDFGQLAVKVASKKGTTEAALKSFKKDDLDKKIDKGVKSAYKRAREISAKRGQRDD